VGLANPFKKLFLRRRPKIGPYHHRPVSSLPSSKWHPRSWFTPTPRLSKPGISRSPMYTLYSQYLASLSPSPPRFGRLFLSCALLTRDGNDSYEVSGNRDGAPGAYRFLCARRSIGLRTMNDQSSSFTVRDEIPLHFCHPSVILLELLSCRRSWRRMR